MVTEFDKWDDGNDPWHKHDLGSFFYKDYHIFWKIDDYDGYEGVDLVLAIMLAEEY